MADITGKSVQEGFPDCTFLGLESGSSRVINILQYSQEDLLLSSEALFVTCQHSEFPVDKLLLVLYIGT